MGLNRLFYVCVFSSVLVACGGGGSSSDTTSTDTGGVDETETMASSLYTGNREPAVVTEANQKLLVGGMLNTGGRITGLTSLLTSSFTGNQTDPYEPVWTFDTTSDCTDGGSLTTTGSFNDETTTGNVQYTYNQCLRGEVESDGSYRIDIHAYTEGDTGAIKITDLTLVYVDLTQTTAGVTQSPVGEIRLKNEGAIGMTATSDLLYLDSTGLQRLDKGLLFDIRQQGTSISGKLCESMNGCVDITTPVPYSGTTQGEIVLTGAANSKVRLRVAEGLRWMDLDADGDDTYESTVEYTN